VSRIEFSRGLACQVFLALLWAWVTPPCLDAQTTWYVDGACGNDAWSGSSPECQPPNGPKRTIQAGMDAAVTGDTVLVADGVYSGPGNKWLSFPALQNFALRSMNGPESCILDLEDSGLAFFFVLDETPEAVVDGFTITRGYSSPTGGIFFHHNCRATIVDCIIEDNYSDYGGGALFIENDSSPTILNCRIRNNSTENAGGAITFAGSSLSSPTIVNCTITGNSAVFGGGAIYCAGFGDSPVMVNCTITENTSPADGGAIYVETFGSLSLVNSIVWQNSDVAIVDEGNLQVSYSDVEGGWPGVGNINANPRFTLANYRVLKGSPCIDAGFDAAVPVGVTRDLGGRPRFIDGDLDGLVVVDMGAQEFLPKILSIR
jgi:predicted outer membrane repeat protein